jgi:hypothetical protein
MIYDSKIIELLDRLIGRMTYLWQQDNAPPHNPSRNPEEFPARMEMLDWPARSPDLSPIEHLWGYLKGKAKGIVFRNADELFSFLADEWDKIPAEVIDQYWSSFQARLQVCHAHQGACLNGRWKEVHRLHHPPYAQGEEIAGALDGDMESHEEEEDSAEGGESD